MGERVAAWWSKVLAGQIDDAHPVYGGDIEVKLDGDRLLVSGQVRSRQDLRRLEAEVKRLRGHGITDYELSVEVHALEDVDEGLLEQTLVGVFDSEEKARFALELLEEHADVKPRRLVLLDRATGKRKLHELVPREYHGEVRDALKGSHVLVVLTVDEVEAFKAREVMEEETRIVTSIALPPQPVGATAPGVHPAVAARPGSSPRGG